MIEPLARPCKLEAPMPESTRHEIACPRCFAKCGWCADYRHMHGKLTLPGTKALCGVKGFEPEGGECPMCHGQQRVIATTVYEAIAL